MTIKDRAFFLDTVRQLGSAKTCSFTHKFSWEFRICFDVASDFTASVKKCDLTWRYEDEGRVARDDSAKVAHLVHVMWIVSHMVQRQVHEHFDLFQPVCKIISGNQ